MKKLMMTIVVAAACGGGAQREPTVPASKPEPATPVAQGEPAPDPGLAVIDEFLADPVQGRATAVLALVSERHDVEVVIPGDLLPALIAVAGVDETLQGLLLTGFVAGDARPQLATGVKGDDFVAGLRGLLQVYRASRAHAAALDELAARDADGTLATWAQAWLTAHPPDAP